MAVPRTAPTSTLPPGSLDETELVLRIRAGDEELVDEVLLALWRNRVNAGAHGAPRAWLYAAMRDQALNHLRYERLVTRLSDRTKEGKFANGEISGVESTVAIGAPTPDAHLADSNVYDTPPARASPAHGRLIARTRC